jgi:hypothetical protein
VNDTNKFKHRPGSIKAKVKSEDAEDKPAPAKPAPAADKPKPAPAADKPKPAADKPKPATADKPSLPSKVTHLVSPTHACTLALAHAHRTAQGGGSIGERRGAAGADEGKEPP